MKTTNIECRNIEFSQHGREKSVEDQVSAIHYSRRFARSHSIARLFSLLGPLVWARECWEKMMLRSETCAIRIYPLDSIASRIASTNEKAEWVVPVGIDSLKREVLRGSSILLMVWFRCLIFVRLNETILQTGLNNLWGHFLILEWTRIERLRSWEESDWLSPWPDDRRERSEWQTKRPSVLFRRSSQPARHWLWRYSEWCRERDVANQDCCKHRDVWRCPWTIAPKEQHCDYSFRHHQCGQRTCTIFWPMIRFCSRRSFSRCRSLVSRSRSLMASTSTCKEDRTASVPSAALIKASSSPSPHKSTNSFTRSFSPVKCATT